MFNAQADAILDWNDALLKAARAARLNPPVFSRAAAVVHIALYDTLNGIQRTHQPYHVTALAPARVSAEAALAAAGYRAALAVISNAEVQQTNFTVLYDTSLAAIPEGPAKTEGIAWGESVANAVLALRAGDGSTNVVPYANEPTPGIWRPVPPGNVNALLPGWGKVAPFCLMSGNQFRPQQPPNLTGAAYALEYDIVRLYGAKTGSSRTPEQSQIAEFWADGAGTETPPGHWNHIAQDVSRARNFSLPENARLFALLNLAQADAAILCWDAKYAYNLWRPVTAIREAETDGNPLTTPDPTWESFIATPPFPEYTSGHSTFSRSAAVVLAHVFGQDNITLTSTSDGLPGVTRTYSSFSSAADESGISRILGGIHWYSANIAGQTTGALLAQHLISQFLVPLTSPSFGLIKVSGQTVDLTLQGEAGRSYRFQGSADLKTWTDVATAAADASGVVRAQDTTPEAYRFYRAEQL
jgi:hypothetical protein